MQPSTAKQMLHKVKHTRMVDCGDGWEGATTLQATKCKAASPHLTPTVRQHFDRTNICQILGSSGTPPTTFKLVQFDLTHIHEFASNLNLNTHTARQQPHFCNHRQLARQHHLGCKHAKHEGSRIYEFVLGHNFDLCRDCGLITNSNYLRVPTPSAPAAMGEAQHLNGMQPSTAKQILHKVKHTHCTPLSLCPICC